MVRNTRTRALSLSSVRNTALELRFRHEWTAFVLVPLALLQLLVYLSTPMDHGALIGIFVATYFLVGHYTRDAEYKLGVPMLLTFIVSRYDILKQNMWEGFSEADGKKADGKKRDGKKADEGDDEPGTAGGLDGNDDEKDEPGAAGGWGDGGRTGFKNKGAFREVNATETSAAVKDTLNDLDDTLGRLENSYDRIMNIGSKLGINHQLNALTKSIDITGILNQKKELK